MKRYSLLALPLVLLFVFLSMSAPAFANSGAPTKADSSALQTTLSYTFNPVADTYVNSAYPLTNFGTTSYLYVHASPIDRGYLKFNVTGISGAITSAKLLMYANNSDSTGFEAFQVTDNSWSETGMTYSNSPSWANWLGMSGAVTAGNWYTVDVTSWIKNAGTWSIALRGFGTPLVSLASRESANKPRLVVTTSSTSTPPPTVPPPTATPPPPPPPSASCETRGTWLNAVALTRTDALLNDMANAHLNTAFVIIPAVGGNNGWSDPSLFASFLSKAKARGFSVHGWIPTYYRTSSTPNWTSSTEQQAQANWAVAVLNAYPQLDGVHLDYIRYMNYSNINSSQMNGVNAVVSAVHSAVKSKYPSKVVTAAVFTDDPRWADFNTEAVPSWFRSYVSANPSSIYGTSNVPQSFKYEQDPFSWIRNGTAEAIAPMQYTMDDASWNKQTAAMKSLLNYQYTNASKAILALTWMKPDSSINSGHDAAGDVRKIKYARSIGMKGFVFFEFSEKNSDGTWYSDAPLISALTVPSSTNNYDAPFAATAPSCLPH